MKKSIMIQGTASSAGKSVLATALCRIFTGDGYNTAPFKSQNMSLNSFITHEGHEMGRAQVMQAEACGKAPSSKMNPILLKPTTDRASQIIVKGVVRENMDATRYYKYKPQLKNMIKDVFEKLQGENEIIVIEGAGSPAEINLKDDDIVNMGMAKIAQAPVILVADIDKGGVFASIYGTIMLLDEDERKMVKGVIINKFRGSEELLKPGIEMLEKLIQIPVLGVIPYFNLNLEDEDSVTDWDKFSDNSQGDLDIAVIKLPKLSNFTDFNALKLHGDVRLRFVDINDHLGNPDMVILPGSKSTMEDLKALRQGEMDKQILKAHDRGSFVFGICGGFQMLGKALKDPLQVESQMEEVEGLSLLPIVTSFEKQKTTTLSEGRDNIFNKPIKGYEIHMGRSHLLEGGMPLIKIQERNGLNIQPVEDGAVNGDETVYGTYFHGIFDNGHFTRSLLNKLRSHRGKAAYDQEVVDYREYKEEQYDKLADIVRNHLNMDAIYGILREGNA